MKPIATAPRPRLTLSRSVSRQPDPSLMLEAQQARRARQVERAAVAAMPPPTPLPPPAPPAELAARHFVHRPADPETLAWNARREAEWHAAHAPIVHALSDPETRAWNQAREAEWHAGMARVETQLRELAPLLFNDAAPVPLAIGIYRSLVELLAGESDNTTIGRFLRDWTSRPAYLAAPVRGDCRRDLDGHPADTPTDNQRKFAAVRLASTSRVKASS